LILFWFFREPLFYDVRMNRRLSDFLLMVLMLTAPAIRAGDTNAAWRSRNLEHFKAPEAHQGVAVDETFFYAIANREIAKYRKADGVRVAQWQDGKGGRFIHLNAGVVKDGKLYAAHSNFPQIPMRSSVEIWDAGTLQHVSNHDFGETDGSLTWVNYHAGHWYAGFAQYAKKGGQPNRGPEWTRVVQYDDDWRLLKEWKFPKELTDRFTPYSCSCAGFGPGGFLYATGHDAREVYVLEISESDSVLKWKATIPVSFEGQGFAWDPARPGVLYGISRKGHEVVAVSIFSPGSPLPQPSSHDSR
jgi:outer membrane protein assembly factor BamB